MFFKNIEDSMTYNSIDFKMSDALKIKMENERS